MAGSSYGTIFRVTTWGESHGKGIGAVVDGCPAGLPLSEEDIQAYLDRRKPGQSKFTTARQEGDQVEILSGVFEVRPQARPSPWRCATRIRDPRTMETLWTCTGRAMRTIPSIRSMDSGTTGRRPLLREGDPRAG